MKVIDLASQVRLSQYPKNLVVFLPAFFAGELFQPEAIGSLCLVFLLFCCCSSVVYMVNDWFDLDADRLHPVKSLRPLARGSISVRQLCLIGLIYSVLATLLLVLCGTDISIYILSFLMINIAYSAGLKHVAIVDIFLIASSFIVRLTAGAASQSVEISPWMMVVAFLLALFLASGKRRDDMLIYLDSRQKIRPVLDGYNLQFLDILITVSASLVILTYILWSVSDTVIARVGSSDLYLSAIFVIFGVMRYLQLIYVHKRSGNPSWLAITDAPLIVAVIAWVGFLILLLYGVD